ncbi:hypothetical protein HMI54_005239 [Coelomomyces lativittatus]|nr:hypothetical protein HMI56_001358 [Coelomomyces lativittatus]KAJ1506229.1 hypothetical protein HMI54_005239 [Coelomomyces lativittatus]
MSYRFLTSCKKIIGVGRNYVDHCKELGNPIPTSPFFFLKPTSSICCVGENIEIPTSLDIHHEVELAVIIGQSAKKIDEKSAMKYVEGYALALDLTSRLLQQNSKKNGLPWTLSKGFDYFTPITPMIPSSEINDPHQLSLWLKVNGEFRQRGKTSDMIFSIPYLISYLSEFMTLEAGDILLTGTPRGVRALNAEDSIEVGLNVDETCILNASWKVKSREIKALF